VIRSDLQSRTDAPVAVSVLNWNCLDGTFDSDRKKHLAPMATQGRFDSLSPYTVP